MTIDGFVRKQLPPAPPEVVAAANEAPVTKDYAEAAAKAVELYMAYNVYTVAHLFKDGRGPIVVQVQPRMVGRVH